MTDYETKQLTLLEKIDQKRGLLVQAAGFTLPEDTERKPMKISRAVLDAIGPDRRGGGWMAR